MDSGLRKRHKRMWLLWAPGLLILIFLALKDLNFSSTSKGLGEQMVERESVKKVENGEVMALLSNTSHGYLLHVWVKHPLRATSSVVYEINEKGEKGTVLGQLQGEGRYSFPCSADINGFVVVDEIKNRQILKLEF